MRKKALTLVEMIVGLSIMAIISGTVLVSFTVVDKQRMDAAARTLAADVSWARQMAVTQHQDYFINFDATNNRYIIYQGSCCVAVNEVRRRNLNVRLVQVSCPTAPAFACSPVSWPACSFTTLRFNPPLGNVTRTDGSDVNTSPCSNYDVFHMVRIDLNYSGADWGVTVLSRTGQATLVTINPLRPRCFIATAAYGQKGFDADKNYIAEEVITLQRFRDNYLLTNRLGRALVNLYYFTSPAIANFIEEREWAKSIARLILKPAAWGIERLGH